MIEVDILIIGAGPAGSTLSKELADANKSHLLVQRNFQFRKPCGGGIRLDAFEEFNIDTALIQTTVNDISLVTKSTRIEIDIKSMPIGIVDRVAFDSALRDQAEKKGTQLLEASFHSCVIHKDHIITQLKYKNEYIEVKSKYLVAADGVNSKIRKLINSDQVNANLTNYADIPNKSYKNCEFHFGSEISDQYYAWAFPHAHGANIGTLAESSNRYMKNLYKHLNIKNEVKTYGYKIPNFRDTLFYKDRVFFVGDSASQVLPFTYEGIYYAMSSARILSNVLIHDLKPQEYEKTWNAKYLKKFSTLLKLQKIFLYNDFMISIMMKILKNSSVQKQMINLWLGKEEVNVDFKFFIKVIKKVLSIK